MNKPPLDIIESALRDAIKTLAIFDYGTIGLEEALAETQKLRESVDVKDLHLILTSGDNRPEHNRIKHYAAKELYNFIGGHDDT